MDLSKLGLKPFYNYFKDTEGVAHSLRPGEIAGDDWVKIDRATYDSLIQRDTIVVPNESPVRAESPVSKSVSDSPVPVRGTAIAIAPPSLSGADSTYGPADFQMTLANLDTLIGEQTGISQLQIDMARKYISEIMITLKTHPEFEGILVDKDVHNVMLFVQSSMNMATAGFIEKKEKKATTAAKKQNAAHSGMTFEMLDFSVGTPNFTAALADDSIKPIEKK